MKSGIYIIRNIVNNNIYIGSATSLQGRKATHFSLLRNKKHYNLHLQRAYNKYGFDSFNFEILEYCLPESLIMKEQYYIDKFNPYYNIAKIAGNTLGVKCSDETKLKISKAHSGKKLTAEHIAAIQKTRKGKVYSRAKCNKNSRAIYKICPDTLTVLERFNSVMEAAFKYNIDHSAINKAGKGKLCKVGGFVWSYVENYDIVTIKQRILNTIGYKIIEQYSKEGLLINTFNGVSDAAKSINKSATAIYHVLEGTNKTAGGYIWKYKIEDNGNSE